MGRILWVLPLCLILQDQRPPEVCPPERPVDSKYISTSSPALNLSEQDHLRHDLIGVLGLTPSTGFPGGLPWHAFYQIGKLDRFPLENILVYQPTLFFQMCLDRHDRDIHSYSCLFCKRERVKTNLQNPEEIKVQFREKPFSVHFEWQKGAGLARKVLYVDGENKGNMRVRPIIGWILTKDPEGPEAMRTSRFSIKQYGMKLALERTLDSMHKAQAVGSLNVCYMGQFKVEKLGDRVCYKFVRKPYNPPEEDGLYEYTFYIDREHWLQVGSELRDANGVLIAEYYFRDVIINPEYTKEQFTDKGL